MEGRRSILGIDAAWTAKEPSGVALVVEEESGWRCAGLASSYRSFCALGSGRPIDWAHPPSDPGEAPIHELLQSAALLGGGRLPDVVAIDMPLSLEKIQGRRDADNAVSRKFGRYWAGTHTPSAERPGPVSDSLRESLENLGYALAVEAADRDRSRNLIEVYPHPAIVSLLRLDKRLPYKESKMSKYWPGTERRKKFERLLENWSRLQDGLGSEIADVPDLTLDLDTRKRKHRKAREDALDALVCAWVGIQFLNGVAVPHGSHPAAIWTPPPPG